MRRLSIRVRLTLAFALAMALVLASIGLVVHERLGSTLLGSVDQSLRVQASEAAARFQRARTLFDPDAVRGTSAGQVIAADGAVVLSYPRRLPPLVPAAARLQVLRRGRPVLRSADVAGLADEWRLLAVPLRHGRTRAVLIVGASLAERNKSLSNLAGELLLAGPAGLLLAVIGGYILAAAALRPVEAMRRRAAAISASTPGARLPVPPARDEISRLAETLNEMLARLESAFEHERRFVADASHELRTPLALLRTELEIALRRPRSQAELTDALESAAEETERLTRLAEDLLLIARSDQGKLPIRRQAVSARELLGEIAARYAPAAAARGRQVLVVDGEDAMLDADPARVGQAVQNLVENALAHGDGAVELSVRSDHAAAELHVEDRGTGFEPAFIRRAFDRFSRADESRSTAGTGLGLAIVDLIVQAHGGSAGIANRQGGGADVWIALPRVTERAVAGLPSPAAS